MRHFRTFRIPPSLQPVFGGHHNSPRLIANSSNGENVTFSSRTPAPAATYFRRPSLNAWAVRPFGSTIQ